MVAAYLADDAVDEIATDYQPISGAVLVEPLDNLETYKYDWYVDLESGKVDVWAAP